MCEDDDDVGLSESDEKIRTLVDIIALRKTVHPFAMFVNRPCCFLRNYGCSSSSHWQ